jgi:hypothetical protein
VGVASIIQMSEIMRMCDLCGTTSLRELCDRCLMVCYRCGSRGATVVRRLLEHAVVPGRGSSLNASRVTRAVVLLRPLQRLQMTALGSHRTRPRVSY